MKIGTTDIKEIFLGTTEVKKTLSGTTPIWAKMTVYFDENTGSSVNNKTVYYKRAYGTLPTTSKTGHTFNGWFTDETWGTEVTEETICNQVDDHTLYAKLDINYYTVTWKDWNGITIKTESVAYGGNGTPPSQPTRTGYTFNTWSGNYTNVTSNRTITATYTINQPRLYLHSRMSEASIGTLGSNVFSLPPNVDINTYACGLNRFYIDENSIQIVNGMATFNVYQCL